jgi:hypothetical protein
MSIFECNKLLQQETKYIQTSDGNSIEIEFPLVSESMEGEYICEAQNFLKMSRKIFHVVVIGTIF